MNYFLFLENTRINIEFAKSFQKRENGKTVFWYDLNPDNEEIYEGLDKENSYFIPRSFGEDFKLSINSLIRENSFEPDFVVVKGEMTEIWPFAALAKEKLITSEIFTVIDGFIPPFSQYDFLSIENITRSYFWNLNNSQYEYLKVLDEKSEEISDLKKICEKIYLTKEFEVKNFNLLERNEKDPDLANWIYEDIEGFFKVEKEQYIHGCEI